MKLKILLIFLAILCFAGSSAHAYWIWTPKTGKWTNPKTAVKPSPKEQFDYAKGIYEIKKYEDAKREFTRLVKSYPKSFEASESQYYLGEIEEALDNLYGAFQAYQKVIDKYPFSERIQDIIAKEYKIGEKFMSGYKQKAFGIALPIENPAIEIFTKIVENSTFGPLASKSQYQLGLVLKGLQRYYEAEEAFNKVVSSYPNSEWAAAAKFQIAACRQAVSQGPAYDQGATQEAKQKFEEFVKEHPDAELSKQAEDNVKKLRQKEAEGSYNIGVFYEKQKAFSSAKIYYTDTVNNYSDTIWADKADERLKSLENKK